MQVVKLDQTHIQATRHLFDNRIYMGNKITMFYGDPHKDRSDFYHEAFHTSYLSGLKNYHAFGMVDSNGQVQGMLTFYQSIDDASWYCTNLRNSGDREVMRSILDEVIRYNEDCGLMKFYTLVSVKHARLLRRWTFSEWANERYGYVDEYMVPAKTQCKYNMPWQVLFNRILLPVDSIVRCSYLKQEFRDQPPVAGFL
jgi:hypothetical protein